jgi:hypothetical protein
MLLELSAQYADALRFLERAAAEAPGDAELQLRIGVQRLRVGDGARGEAALRGCLADGTPEWVRVVATQELARRLEARGQRDAGLELLAAEAERRPDAGTLLLLARLHDAAGRRGTAQELLARLEAAELSEAESPRLRYGRRRFPELERSNAEFAAAAHARSARLGDALETLERNLRSRSR